jgi:hypothetical protein
MQKLFILYDARAQSGDTDDALVLDTASTERECRRISADHAGEHALWYEYDDKNGQQLVNGKARYDL